MPVEFLDDEPSGKGVVFLDDEQDNGTQKNDLISSAKRFAGYSFLPGSDIVSSLLRKANPQVSDFLDKSATSNAETALGFIDSATLGVPRFLAEKAGVELPKSENGIATTVGRLAGLMVPGGAISKGVSKIPQLAGKDFIHSTLRGGVEGFLTGAALPPDEFDNIKARAFNASTGLILGGLLAPAAGRLAGMLKNMHRFRQTKGVGVNEETINLATKVRDALYKTKYEAGKVFGQELDDLIQTNPGKNVSLEVPVNNLKQSIFETIVDSTGQQTNQLANPRLQSVLKTAINRAKTGTDKEGAILLEKALFDPKAKVDLNALTLNQSRQMARTINNVPSISSKLKALERNKIVDWSPEDTVLQDFIHDIKNEQLGSFPELANINKRYSQVINAYNRNKSRFSHGKLLGQMKNRFSDAGFGKGEVLNEINQLLPKGLMGEIDDFSGAVNNIEVASGILKSTAQGIAAAGAGALVFNKLRRGND